MSRAGIEGLCWALAALARPVWAHRFTGPSQSSDVAPMWGAVAFIRAIGVLVSYPGDPVAVTDLLVTEDGQATNAGPWPVGAPLPQWVAERTPT